MSVTANFLYLLRLTTFMYLIIFGSLAINWIQLLGQALIIYRPFYRRYMKMTQRMFGSLILVTTYILSPLEIVVTGCHDELNNETFAPIIANHQIYTDWWYIWLFSWFRGSHGNIKIIMKRSLRSIPIMGWGMRCFEFIFLARNWKIDKLILTNSLIRARKDGTPMWLLLFPEGTVITDDTKAKSQQYVKKLGISDDPKYVLVPKSTGLYHTIRCLEPKAEYLYDITIGYSGLDGKMTPFDRYSPSAIFFEGKGPRSIHFHVNRFKISDIPGVTDKGDYSPEERTDPVFDEWLRKRFLEKDAMLAEFYQVGRFTESSTELVGPKQTFPIDPEIVDWISLLGLLFTSATSLSWMCL